MADIFDNALAQYYGPREQGLATVLPAQRSAPFSTLVKVVAAAKANKAKSTDILKDLKSQEAWRPFMGEYQKRYNEALDKLTVLIAAGDTEQAAILAKRYGQELASYAQASMQVGEAFNSLWNDARKSGIVRSDAYAQWLRTALYDEEGNLRDPREIDIESLTLENLTQIDGASEIFNGSKVLRQVADEVLKPVDFYSEMDVPDKITGPFRQFRRMAISGKLRPYEEYDPVQHKVVVKDPERLAEEGIVDALMENPYARRIIEDYASQRYGGEPRHQAVVKATYDLINEYQLSDGTVKEKLLEDIETYPTAGGGSSKKADTSPHPWLTAIDDALRGDVKGAKPVSLPKELIPGAKEKGVNVPTTWLDVSHLFGAKGNEPTTLPTITAKSIGDPQKTVTLHATRVFASPETKELIVEYSELGGKQREYKRFVPNAKGEKGASPIYDLILNAGKTVYSSAKNTGYLDDNNNFVIKGGVEANVDVQQEYERQVAINKNRLVSYRGDKTVFDLLAEGQVSTAIAQVNAKLAEMRPYVYGTFDGKRISGVITEVKSGWGSVSVKIVDDNGQETVVYLPKRDVAAWREFFLNKVIDFR